MSEVTDTFSGVNNIKVTSSKARHLHECEVRSTALSPHPSPIVFCFNLSSAFTQLYLLTLQTTMLNADKFWIICYCFLNIK